MSNYKVSIIEDDEITALNLKLSLEKQGYEVVSVFDNPLLALTNIPLNVPNIFIIDISLQDSNDGINLAREIKEKYALPFIYLTSHSDDEIISQAKLTKPYGYIVKPFHPNSLHASIQMALFQYESELTEDVATVSEKLSVEELLKTKSSNSITLTFATNYLFNIQTNELFYNEVKVDLKDVEAVFIRILVAKLGLVISFEEATAYILKITKENVSIRTLVWRLRNRLATDIIKNAASIGYYIEE